MSWLMRRARACSLRGLRTILVARTYALVGVLLALHDLAAPYFAGLDWEPIMPERVRPFVPIGLVCTGIIFEGLRRVTIGPPGQPVSGG